MTKSQPRARILRLMRLINLCTRQLSLLNGFRGHMVAEMPSIWPFRLQKKVLSFSFIAALVFTAGGAPILRDSYGMSSWIPVGFSDDPKPRVSI